MTADLQDAVTLARSTDRTPLQRQSKLAYDALCEALDYAISAGRCTSDPIQTDRIRRVQGDIERVFSTLVLVMHPEDGE